MYFSDLPENLAQELQLAPAASRQSLTLPTSARLAWKCTRGHTWHARLAHRLRGSGCPYCRGQRAIPGETDLPTKRPDIFRQWHPTRNTLDPTTVMPHTKKLAWWLCEQGHEWEASIANRAHHAGQCVVCNHQMVQAGISDIGTTDPALAAQFHPTLNGSVTVEQVSRGSNKKRWWLCGQNHAWEATVASRSGQGAGCPYCQGVRVITDTTSLQVTDPVLAAEWHPTKNSPLTPGDILPSSGKKYWWLGLCSHSWLASARDRSRGNGCAVCAGMAVEVGKTDFGTTHPLLASELHPHRNNGTTAEQFTAGSARKLWWQCSQKHEWEAAVYSRTAGARCPQCFFKSKPELALRAFIEGLLDTPVQANVRNLILGIELDVFIPHLSLAIEFNGLYWHSDRHRREHRYHWRKWKLASDVGIQLIQIWEDDWQRRPETVKAMLTHKLGQSTARKVYARATTVVSATAKTARDFLEANHIQGFAAGSHYLALQTQTGASVALMVLKREPGTAGRTLNIIRYATAANVPGGFTKLLRAAERMYAPARFLTFSDHTISDGGLYARNGFVKDGEVRPDYMYVVGGERRHKFGYRLKRFRNDPALKFEAGLSERELAALNGLPRIWDAGKTRWVREAMPVQPPA